MFRHLEEWNGIWLYLQDEPYRSKYRPTEKGGEKRVNRLMVRFLNCIGKKAAQANRFEKYNNANKVQRNFTKFVEFIKRDNS